MTVSSEKSVSPKGRPGRLLRLALRGPVLVYRAGLGGVFGHHLLMVTHTGRKSHRQRRTVVEVVAYDRRTQESIVAAGWGTATQWYRNIQASDAVEVHTGSRHYRPSQRFLGDDEARAVLERYLGQHRLAARFILRWLGFSWDEAGREAFVQRLRLVAFRPR